MTLRGRPLDRFPTPGLPVDQKAVGIADFAWNAERPAMQFHERAQTLGAS